MQRTLLLAALAIASGNNPVEIIHSFSVSLGVTLYVLACRFVLLTFPSCVEVEVCRCDDGLISKDYPSSF